MLTFQTPHLDTRQHLSVYGTAAGLIVYCGLLVILSGDIGFDGDDWWVLSRPFWYDFPNSFLVYARDFLRPVEGLYWIGMFELFGFNRVAFHFGSVLLLVGAVFLQGLCLSKAFPRSPVLVVFSMLFAFFFPMVSSLTYVLFTDNARLSLLLFWASVLMFQRWTERGGSWLGQVPAILLYLLSFLAYEGPGFLVLAVPLLVWPVYRTSPKALPGISFLFRVLAGISISFALAVGLRFCFFSGGPIDLRRSFPSPELVWTYLAVLPSYLAAPFTTQASNQWAICLGTFVAVWIIVLLYFLSGVGGPIDTLDNGSKTADHQPTLYLIVVGSLILVLGMLPYQLAGYGSWFNFNGASRVYSSATGGLAIVFAAAACGFRKKLPSFIFKAVATVSLGVMAAFHAGLCVDWNEAGEMRKAIIGNLLGQVPEVEPGTNFVLLNLEFYHKRAAVFRCWFGLQELFKMLYGDRSVGAWYLRSSAPNDQNAASNGSSEHRVDAQLLRFSATDWPTKRPQQAIVLPTGFLSRSMNVEAPAPHDSLLLFKCDAPKLLLLDKICRGDGLVITGISWRECQCIISNLKRIRKRAEDEEMAPHHVRGKTERKTELLRTLLLDRPRTSVPISRGRP
jgi:hypothetical protein